MKNNNEEILLNFKKAGSHLSKVIKMVEAGEYCINTMQQNLAVIGLLKSAHQKLMENHLNGCFLEAAKTKDPKKETEMIEEILKVTKLYNK